MRKWQRHPAAGLSIDMRVLLVVLAEQILAVVVAVRGAHHGVDVLTVRRFGICRKVAQADRLLMIEFNQNHRAVDAVVEDTVRFNAPNPGKPGIARGAGEPRSFSHGCARRPCFARTRLPIQPVVPSEALQALKP